MVFCPICGAENSDPGKYCKYCGSDMELPETMTVRSKMPPVAPSYPAASAPSPGVMQQRKPKKKGKKVAIVIIVLFAIAGGSFGIFMAATWGTYAQTVPFAYYASDLGH